MLIICASEEEAKDIAEAIAGLIAETEDDQVAMHAVHNGRVVWTDHENVIALPFPSRT